MSRHTNAMGLSAGERAIHEAGAAVPRPARRWRTRVLLPAAVIASAAGLLGYTGREALRRAVDVEVMPVVVRAAAVTAPDEATAADEAKDSGSGAVAAQAPGWIEPDPYATNVPALANGIVREVLVLEGQRVAAGEVVARLIDDEARLALARAEAEVRERMAEMVVAEADLKFAKAMWDNPTEQTRVAAVSDALFAEARAELARLPLEIAAASARLDELRDDLTRKQELLEKRAISDGEVAQLRLRVSAQEAALDAAKAKRPVLEAQVRAAEAEAVAGREMLRLRSHDTRDLTRTYAMLEAAKAKQVRAETDRDEARLRMERMEVRSPVAGVVMARLTEPGSKVMMEMDEPGSSWVVRLYDPSKLQVRVDVPLASAAGLGVGMAAEVIVEATPGRVFKGRVSRLVHEANIQKNTVQVKVALEETSMDMKPEMLARVKLFASGAKMDGAGGERAAGSTATGVLMAPVELLVGGAGGVLPGSTATAWVVDQSRSEARRREVRLGRIVERSDGMEWIEVSEGLRPGDRLIAADVSGLREGVKIRVKGEREGGVDVIH